MPIEPRATLRFALGLGVAAAIGWGRGGQFAFLLPMLAVLLLAPGTPPPAMKQVPALVVIIAISCLWGLLMAPVLMYAAPVGVILILFGVAAAAYLSARTPALAVPLKLFIVGDTLIATIAYQSQQLALMVALQLTVDLVLAVAIAWGTSILLPDNAADQLPLPPPMPAPLDGGEPGWIALRSALVMGLPIVLALDNPGLFLMTLMNGAQLAQLPDATQVRQNGQVIVTSTAAGSVMAMSFWLVLGWWPSLVLLAGGLTLIALLLGPRLHGAGASAQARAWWPPTLSTMIIVLGSAVSDSADSDGIAMLMARRITMMLTLTVAAAAMVHVLDEWRARLRPLRTALATHEE